MLVLLLLGQRHWRVSLNKIMVWQMGLESGGPSHVESIGSRM